MSRRLIPSASFFFIRIASYQAIWSLLCFHKYVKIFCSSSVKNAIGNLVGIALNLLISLDSIVTLMILILPIQEHGISFHLFVSFSLYIYMYK